MDSDTYTSSEGMPMSDEEQYLDNARKCFQQAAAARDIASARKFADLGITYLRMAHDEAAVVDSSQPRLRPSTIFGQ